MMYLLRLITLSLLLTPFLSTAVFAADMTSAIGNWVTIDDKTGKPKSVVSITQVENELRGTIVDIFDPAKKNSVCEKCKGTNKDKKIIGLTFMWGLKKANKGWVGGSIIDPENGKVYKAKMELIEDGKKLKVRGFIGLALIGRTQTWERQ